MTRPKCFISYSWDSDRHKDLVRRLATELTINGVRTYLDQWDVRPGMDLTQYVETCIRKSGSVLLVCTPTFAQKANSGRGGVGYEKAIVTGEMFEGATSEKFVPLLWKGTPKESLPSYLKSRAYIDFRKKDRFKQNLESLLRHLYQSPRYVRPPMGKPPALKPVVLMTNVRRPRKQSSQNRRTVVRKSISYEQNVMNSLTEYPDRHDARRIFETVNRSDVPMTQRDIQRRLKLPYGRIAKTIAILEATGLLRCMRIGGRFLYSPRPIGVVP